MSDFDESNSFKSSLVAFAFMPRSSGLGISKKRIRQPFDVPQVCDEHIHGDGLQVHGGTSGPPLKKKRVRGYADPEVYAYLQGLPDILSEGLDIIFCGINPGGKSAEIGHHYGHHSNHFWDCLYQSGLTSSKLPPEEDQTLPERFSIGLTNLVERPTAEQNELSSEEQAASVPTLLAKIARYRPRILCFLGLSIARTFQSQLIFSPKPLAKTKKSGLGLQAYKLVHDAPDSTSDTTETLFYALPSPSARVVQPQKSGKIALFAIFRDVLNQVKKGDYVFIQKYFLRCKLGTTPITPNVGYKARGTLCRHLSTFIFAS